MAAPKTSLGGSIVTPSVRSNASAVRTIVIRDDRCIR
jgi:hypothetical protein